ncbi:MAG: DUF1800 family protein [Actinomycetota bacterium]
MATITAGRRTIAARVLGRLTFGPFSSQLDEAAELSPDALVSSVLARPALPAPDRHPGEDTEEEWHAPVDWWLRRMADPAAGLHERMVWFWHGHLTSSVDKVGDWQLMWEQHLLLRELAFGNVRELLQRVTTDRAMLWYLDGDHSWGEEPNENYSRELMELFAIGRGNYTEDDVRAGARALSGWWVEWVDDGPGPARFDPDRHWGRPVPFLGTTVTTAADVVDAVCDHPAIGPFLAGALHEALVGVAPSPERGEQLGRVLVANDLEVLPLVEAILEVPELRAPEATRARTGAEWLVAAGAVFGGDSLLTRSAAENVGQMPFNPPNVSGWPAGPSWASSSQYLSRMELLSWPDAQPSLPDAGVDEVVEAVLQGCALVDVRPETRAALTAAARSYPDDPESRSHLLHVLAVLSPEFAVV